MYIHPDVTIKKKQFRQKIAIFKCKIQNLNRNIFLNVIQNHLLETFPDCSCQKPKRTHERSANRADVHCSIRPDCRSETFSVRPSKEWRFNYSFVMCVCVCVSLKSSHKALTWCGTSRTISSLMHVSQTRQLRYTFRRAVPR